MSAQVEELEEYASFEHQVDDEAKAEEQKKYASV
jgi:hypothetical protein